MKICRTTRTLADVQREVREALRKAEGIHEGVYTQLDAYLELIVPEIARAPTSRRRSTSTPGLNVMDVSGSPTPMQMLFVQSAIDWVNEHETQTVVIVPEAWEFIPQGKGSPVKASAVALVRKGAGARQLHLGRQPGHGRRRQGRSSAAAPVWLIGVQREANEIKRNLANIPAGIKRPNAATSPRSSRGQFFACWGQHCVLTYVQPALDAPTTAADIARGNRPVESFAAYAAHQSSRRNRVNQTGSRGARTVENTQLKARIRDLEDRLDACAYQRAPTRRTGAMPTPLPAGSAAIGLSMLPPYQAIKARLLAELPSDPVPVQAARARSQR